MKLESGHAQQRMLGRFDGISRFIYNWGLAEWHRRYDAGEKTSYVALANSPSALEKQDGYERLKLAPSHCLQQVLKNLDRSYRNFLQDLEMAKHASAHAQRQVAERGGAQANQGRA